MKDFPNYDVTKNGEVFNLKTGKKLKGYLRNGYLRVKLYITMVLRKM